MHFYRNMYRMLTMGELSDLERIFSFLELELTSDSYKFFLGIKKCYETDLGLFRNFMTDYLTIQNNSLVEDSGDIYNDFVCYFSDMREIQGENALLEQFARYAKYYLMLNYTYIKNEDFKHWVSIINSYNGKIAYPFLMELLDDFEYGRIDQAGLNEMALMIVNLLKNSTLGAHNLRREFATLGYNVNKMLGNTKARMAV